MRFGFEGFWRLASRYDHIKSGINIRVIMAKKNSSAGVVGLTCSLRVIIKTSSPGIFIYVIL
jgi:hypothetical protein